MYEALCLRWVRIDGMGLLFVENVVGEMAVCWSDVLNKVIRVNGSRLSLA